MESQEKGNGGNRRSNGEPDVGDGGNYLNGYWFEVKTNMIKRVKQHEAAIFHNRTKMSRI